MMGKARRTIRKYAGLLLLLPVVALASACNGTELPQVIATYPRQDPPPPETAVTEARVELEVRDVATASDEVTRLAARHGGYVVESQSWNGYEAQTATLAVLVPAGEFEAFYRGLLTLGRPLSERLTERAGGYGVRNTHVSIVLREATPSVTVHRSRGWNPVATFQSAFAVFMRIFQVLVDGLIWILVVAGPFVLMALGLLALIRHLRRSPVEQEE